MEVGWKQSKISETASLNSMSVGKWPLFPSCKVQAPWILFPTLLTVKYAFPYEFLPWFCQAFKLLSLHAWWPSGLILVCKLDNRCMATPVGKCLARLVFGFGAPKTPQHWLLLATLSKKHQRVKGVATQQNGTKCN